MPETSQERATAVRAALQEIAAEYGRDALSSPATISNLVKDLLPDDQQIARILVVAAEQRIPDTLREHVSQGMDAATAIRLVASSFAASTLFAEQACTWVVGELAVALGISSDSDIGAGPVAVNGSESTKATSQPTHTAPTVGAAQPAPAGTVPRQPQVAATGSPGPPAAQPLRTPAQPHENRRAPGTFDQQIAGQDAGAHHPGRRGRSILAIAIVVVLVLAVGAIVLLTQQSPNNPQSSPSAPQGTHPVHRQIADNGSLVVTLTTITVHRNVMTVDVSYRNATSTLQALDCAGYGDPSIVTVKLASGTVLHANATYCSDHPDALLPIGQGDAHHSYATFALTGTFSQPFRFNWPYGILAGSVSNIEI